MTRIVYRHQVPVDDQWHTYELRGPVLHVATRTDRLVELWALYDTDQPVTKHAFRVVGTGHPLTGEMTGYVGTAIAPGGRFIWHLFERERPIVSAVEVGADRGQD